jgi:hypothetical protein
MAFSPIAFIAPNYSDYGTYFLKAYLPGSTTPKPLAIDAAGTTTFAKLQLNVDGFFKSAGGAVITPYVDGAYDAYLFETEAEADANNTASAIRLADNILPLSDQQLRADLADGSADVNLDSDLSQAYVFDTVALMKASTIVFPIAKKVTCKRYYAAGELIDGLVFEVQASAAVDGYGNHTLANGNIAVLIASKVVDAKLFGAKVDNATDDLASFVALIAYCKLVNKELTWSSISYISDTLAMREVGVSAPAGSFRVETTKFLVLGGRASSPANAKQEIYSAFRTADAATIPCIQVKGAKGQTITIHGQVNFVQLYADTNSTVYSTDYSIAYNNFFFTRVIALELTNNPTTNGSSIQWINENAFYLKRTNQILINGTYPHNHNVFYTPNIEATGAVLINIDTGSSNLFYDCRLEGVTGADIIFGVGTWGNKIFNSWMEHPWNRIATSNPASVDITDNGVQNEVVWDFNADMTKTLIAERSASTQTTNRRTDFLSNAVPSLGLQYNTNNGNNTLAITSFIPAAKGDAITFSVKGGNAVPKFRCIVECFDEDMKKVTLTNSDLISSTLTTYSSNVLTVGVGVSSATAVFLSDNVKFYRARITSSFNQQFDGANSIYITSHSASKNISVRGQKLLQESTTASVSSRPTQAICDEGYMVSDGTTMYTCIYSAFTHVTGTSSSAVVTVDSVGAAAANDLIGVVLDTGLMLWSTIASISGSAITMNDSLGSAATNTPVKIVRFSP